VSLINNNYKKSIDEVFNCFSDTEHKIKQFEMEHGQLPIPSINELRYVGYHFVKASQAKSETGIKEHIKKALNHSKRAKFDTYEASTMILLERLKDFHERYNSVKETQDIISNYIEYLASIQQISDKLKEIVATEYESREKYYEDIGINHNKLKEISQKFEIAKPQIELLVTDNNSKKIRETRRFIIGIGVALFSTVAILSTKLGWWNMEDTNTKKEHVQESNRTLLIKIKS